MEAQNYCGSVISIVEISKEQSLSGCSYSGRDRKYHNGVCANSEIGLFVRFPTRSLILLGWPNISLSDYEGRCVIVLNTISASRTKSLIRINYEVDGAELSTNCADLPSMQ